MECTLLDGLRAEMILARKSGKMERYRAILGLIAEHRGNCPKCGQQSELFGN